MNKADEERERQVRRKLDEVVGTGFDEPGVRGLRAWLGSRWLKWVLGAAFAVAAMLLVVYTIESHRLPTSIPAPAKKPVPVQIIPPR